MKLTRRNFLISSITLGLAFVFVGQLDGKRYDVSELGLYSNKKIVFLTDLHIHSFNEVLLEKINSLEPEIVLLGGDTYDKQTKNLKIVEDFLREIKGKKIGVLGNHEHWAQYRFNAISLEKGLKMYDNADVKILRDERITMDGIKIAGIDWKENYNEYKNMDLRADITIVHNPDYYHYTKPNGLVLAGHTHGGQICLPGNHSIITNSRYGYEQGFYIEKEKSILYVSRGLGEMIPPRLYCSREIVIV